MTGNSLKAASTFSGCVIYALNSFVLIASSATATSSFANNKGLVGPAITVVWTSAGSASAPTTTNGFASTDIPFKNADFSGNSATYDG